MLRWLPQIFLLFFLFLTGIFLRICWMEWFGPRTNEMVFFCGVVDGGPPFSSQDSLLEVGKDIFRSNCASCHARDMRSKLTGPPLRAGVLAWKPYPREDLYLFIRNSQSLIQQKHPQALLIWEEYRPTIMTSFENLTDEDLEAVLAYIMADYSGS